MASVAGRCARVVLSAAADRAGAHLNEEIGAVVDALARAAVFFGTEDGACATKVLQSSRIPVAERRTLREEIAKELDLPGEVTALVETLAAGRSLRSMRAVAGRAAAAADAFTDVARVEVRTAKELPEGVSEGLLARIGSAMEKILRRPVRIDISEDPGLLAGMVVRAGDRIWDGSLLGRMARSREELSVGDIRAAKQGAHATE